MKGQPQLFKGSSVPVLGVTPRQSLACLPGAVPYLGKLISADFSCVSPGLGEGMGSLSSRPYSSPLDAAEGTGRDGGGGRGGGGHNMRVCNWGQQEQAGVGYRDGRRVEVAPNYLAAGDAQCMDQLLQLHIWHCPPMPNANGLRHMRALVNLNAANAIKDHEMQQHHAQRSMVMASYMRLRLQTSLAHHCLLHALVLHPCCQGLLCRHQECLVARCCC